MMLPRRTLLATAASLPFAAARAATSAPRPLRFGLQVYPPSFLPWQNTGTASATVNLCTRRGLLSYGHDGSLHGELAESWNSDGEIWTFSLRDARFHNGEKVTAEDVKWTIAQITAPDSTAYLRGSMRDIDRVETPDDTTVRLITRKPIATLPYWLAIPQAPIISRHSPDAKAGAIGAGPYVITEQERGVGLKLAAFPHYYKPGLPKLPQLHMLAYADDNLRVSALQAGDLDLIEYVPWQAMDTLAADTALRMSRTVGPCMYMNFNGQRGPFKDARVRQAVAYAARRSDVAQASFYGHAVDLTGLPIAPDSPYYDAALAHFWRYDPQHAKQLLTQAGYPNGFSCTLLANGTSSMTSSSAIVMQQALAEIGITVELALMEYATYLKLSTQGKYELAVCGGTMDSNDPDGLTTILDGSLPPSPTRSFGMYIPEVTNLLAAGRAEFDTGKRKQIYDQLQRVVLNQVPAAFMVLREQAYAMRADVQGFVNLPGQITFYSGYTLEDTYFA